MLNLHQDYSLNTYSNISTLLTTLFDISMYHRYLSSDILIQKFPSMTALNNHTYGFIIIVQFQVIKGKIPLHGLQQTAGK
jgi:hypothetical protein